MSEQTSSSTPPQPTPSKDPAHLSDPADPNKTLTENQKLSTSGLSWDQTEPKPGEKFNRVTEMGEAD